MEDVDPSGPGAAAGLLPGDVLVSLAAEPIYTLRDLFRVESSLSPGTSVELAVMRGPDAQLLRLTPDPAPQTPAALSAASVTEKDNLVFRLGMYGTALTPPLASTLGGLRGVSGVLVLALAGAGLPGQSALEVADVIHAVNGKPVDSVESLRSSLEAVPDGAPPGPPGRARRPAVLRNSGRYARRRAAPQEDRFPRACRESPRPCAPFRIEDRQAPRLRGPIVSGALSPPSGAMRPGWRREESARRS